MLKLFLLLITIIQAVVFKSSYQTPPSQLSEIQQALEIQKREMLIETSAKTMIENPSQTLNYDQFRLLLKIISEEISETAELETIYNQDSYDLAQDLTNIELTSLSNAVKGVERSVVIVKTDYDRIFGYFLPGKWPEFDICRKSNSIITEDYFAFYFDNKNEIRVIRPNYGVGINLAITFNPVVPIDDLLIQDVPRFQIDKFGLYQEGSFGDEQWLESNEWDFKADKNPYVYPTLNTQKTQLQLGGSFTTPYFKTMKFEVMEIINSDSNCD